MKRFFSIFLVLVMTSMVSMAYADSGRLHKGRFIRGGIDFPLGSFVISDRENATVGITASTNPGYATLDGMTKVVWDDGQFETALEVNFQLPDDYHSDGKFIALVTRDNTHYAPAIDFDVYILTNKATTDSSATDQTAVRLDEGYASSPQEVELIPTADAAWNSLVPGQWINFRITRDDTNASTEDLELIAVKFVYNQIGY